MADNPFGGAWTEWKLDAVVSYIREYLRITGGGDGVNTKGLERWYVDIFAGCGSRTDPVKKDEVFAANTLWEDMRQTKVYEGSAHRALDFGFERFLLAEKDPSKAADLRSLAEQHGKGDCTTVVTDDGREVLRRWCSNIISCPRARAVVFLDPFDMAVEWDLMHALADTKIADVWILFPVKAILQNLPINKIAISPAHAATLTRYFGDDGWMNTFYRQQAEQQTLFGVDPGVVREAKTADIVKYYQVRLRTIFQGGVDENVRWLVNRQGAPLFALLFAMANPDPRAHKPGLRVARHILRKTEDTGLS
jgi:three-Cys-motif partner protein